MERIINKKQILWLVMLTGVILFNFSLTAKTVVTPVNWGEIQPTETEYLFSDLDAKIRGALANKDLVMLQFEGTPKWLCEKTIPNITPEEVSRAKPPIDEYAAFALRVARRYKGKIEGYLLWKNPAPNNLLATDTEIYAMFDAGIKAIQEAGEKAILPDPGNVNIVWIYNYFLKLHTHPNGIFLYPTLMQSPDEFGLRLHNLYTKIIKTKNIDIYADFNFISDADSKRKYKDIIDINKLNPLPGKDIETSNSDIIYINPKLVGTFKTYSPTLTMNKVESNFGPEHEASKIEPLKELPGGSYFFLNSVSYGKLLITRPNSRDQSKNNPFLYFDVPNDFIFFNVEGMKLKITLTFLGTSTEGVDGFNLHYDSTTGLKSSADWIWISKGRQEKFTYSIVLDDAAFASSYGYDFRINAGASPSAIYLVDVTVTKLNSDGTEKENVPVRQLNAPKTVE